MTSSTFLQIKELLDENKIIYEHVTHEYVHRSEDAAKIRGTELHEAAKAIILKVERKSDEGIKYFDFIQVVIGGDQRIDLKKLKLYFDSKNISLASPEEVLEKTGCTIGSVPPFGTLFNIPAYMDNGLLEKERIVFSAGTHNDSIIMHPQDYVKIVEPIVENFRKE
ncbi:MAG: aminoacyl-tRNA deacylase [Candidatus Woesearchaeota archaeon]